PPSSHLDRRSLRRLDRGPFRPEDEHLVDVRREAFRERDDVRPRVPRSLDLEDVGDLPDVLARGHQDRRALAQFVVLDDLLDEDAAVVQDMPGLAGGVADLEHVPEDRAERHALADPMRAGRGTDDPEVGLAGDRPGPRGGQSLEVLLHFDFSSSLRRRHASVSSIRMIRRFEACKGLATFFSSTFSIVMPSMTTVPCTRSTETTLPSRPRNPP